MQREVAKWLQSFELSQSVRRGRHELQNGVLIAEILENYSAKSIGTSFNTKGATSTSTGTSSTARRTADSRVADDHVAIDPLEEDGEASNATAATRKAALPQFRHVNSKEKLVCAQSLSTGQSMETLQSNWHVLRPILRKLWKLRSKSASRSVEKGETNCGNHTTLVYLDALIYGTMYALEGAGVAMVDELYEILSGAVLAEKHTFDISPNWSPQLQMHAQSGNAVLERDSFVAGTLTKRKESAGVYGELPPESQKLLSWNDKNPPRLLVATSPARERTAQRQLAPQYAQPTGSALVHVLTPSSSKVVVPGKGPIFPDEALLQKQSQETLREHTKLMQQVRNAETVLPPQSKSSGTRTNSGATLVQPLMESVAKVVANAASLGEIAPLAGPSGHSYSFEKGGLLSAINSVIRTEMRMEDNDEEEDEDEEEERAHNAAHTFISHGSFGSSSDSGSVWNALLADAPVIASFLCASVVLENVDEVRENAQCVGAHPEEEDNEENATRPVKGGNEMHVLLELLSPLFSARTSASVRLLHVSRIKDVAAAVTQSLATTPRKVDYNLESPIATSPAAAAAGFASSNVDSTVNASSERMRTSPPRKSRIAHRQSVADALLHAFTDEADQDAATTTAEVATSLRRDMLLSQNARSASVVDGPRQSCIVGGGSDDVPAVVVVDHHRAKRWLADADAMHVACAYKFLFSVLKFMVKGFSTFAGVLADLTDGTVSHERSSRLRRAQRTVTDLFLSKVVQSELIPFLCKDAVPNGTPAIVDGVARLLVCATPRLDGPAATAAKPHPLWVHLLSSLYSDIPAALHISGLMRSLNIAADNALSSSQLSVQRAYHLLCYYSLRQIPAFDRLENTAPSQKQKKKKNLDEPTEFTGGGGGAIADATRTLFGHALQNALYSLEECEKNKTQDDGNNSWNPACASAAAAFYETLSLRVLALRIQHDSVDEKEIHTCVDDLVAAIAARVDSSTSSDTQSHPDSPEQSVRALSLRHWEARIAAIDALHAYVRRHTVSTGDGTPREQVQSNSLDAIETALIELLRSFMKESSSSSLSSREGNADSGEVMLAAQYAMQLVARQLQPDLFPRLAQVWVEQINAHPRTHLAHLLVPLSEYVINERTDNGQSRSSSPASIAMQSAQQRQNRRKKSGVLNIHDPHLLNDLLAAPKSHVVDPPPYVENEAVIHSDDDPRSSNASEPEFLEYTKRGGVEGNNNYPEAAPATTGDTEEGAAIPTPSVQLLFGLNEPAYAIVPLNQVWDKFTVVRCALLHRSSVSVETLISLIAAALLTPSSYRHRRVTSMEEDEHVASVDEEVKVFWRTVAREIRGDLLASMLTTTTTTTPSNGTSTTMTKASTDGWVDREETAHAVAAALYQQCVSPAEQNNKDHHQQHLPTNPNALTVLQWLKNL